MTLPLLIGKTSNNKDVIKDLAELPHLFLSYTEEGQVASFLKNIADSLNVSKTHLFQMSLAVPGNKVQYYQPLMQQSLLKYSFLPGAEMICNCRNRKHFFSMLAGEMRFRKNKLKKHKSTAIPFSLMLVVLHDVLDMVLSSTRTVGLTFIEMLLQGRELNMHLIAFSGSSYQNLLRQLMVLHPEAAKKFGVAHNEKVQLQIPLGAELVINGDGFLFYREAFTRDYQRLYPIEKSPVAKDNISANSLLSSTL